MRAVTAGEWGRLRPLPGVHPHYRSRKSRTWEHARDHWASLPAEPLIITADLVTPVIHAEAGMTHLDGILSWAALTAHPVESDCTEMPVIPLPVGLIWVNEDGLPLWACTPLTPESQALEGVEYWHKRYPVCRAELGARRNAVVNAGRWKECRMPVQVQAPARLTALCLGHKGEVERLLGYVSHVGKKGSMGYGRVARWTVTAGHHTIEDILARRPVPIEYFSGQVSGLIRPRRSWTPPHWYAPRHAPCLMPAL